MVLLIWYTHVCSSNFFESVDKILWCDHSNEISSAVVSHGAVHCSAYLKMKFANSVVLFLFFSTFLVKGKSDKANQEEATLLLHLFWTVCWTTEN